MNASLDVAEAFCAGHVRTDEVPFNQVVRLRLRSGTEHDYPITESVGIISGDQVALPRQISVDIHGDNAADEIVRGAGENIDAVIARVAGGIGYGCRALDIG